MPWPEVPPTALAAIKRRGSRSLSRELQGAHPRCISCPPAAEMVQATPLLLVLFLALGAHSLQGTQQCKLTGKWKNDLGSNMTISEINGDGDFTGTYHTAVSASPRPIEESPLVGSQQLPYASQPTFGFTVHWSFTDTIAVFTGQCFVDEQGKEVLKTMWLLRLHSDKLGNDWKATLAGYNTFRRL